MHETDDRAPLSAATVSIAPCRHPRSGVTLPARRTYARSDGPTHHHARGRDLFGDVRRLLPVFFLFSNRLGCVGSLMVSAVTTALLVLLLWR